MYNKNIFKALCFRLRRADLIYQVVCIPLLLLLGYSHCALVLRAAKHPQVEANEVVSLLLQLISSTHLRIFFRLNVCESYHCAIHLTKLYPIYES